MDGGKSEQSRAKVCGGRTAGKRAGSADSLITGQFEVYGVATDGTDVTRLTFGGGRDIDPAWSLDGKQIPFGSDRDFVAQGIRQVSVMNADGSNQQPLTTLPSENAHACRGRGRRGRQISTECVGPVTDSPLGP